MNPTQIFILLIAYFGLLFVISYLTGKSDSNEAFFKANSIHLGISLLLVW